MAIDFDTEFDPRHGEVVEVSPLLRRVVCPNESKYTFQGTGTYIVGRGDVAIVDPGPDDADHIAVLLGAVGAESVSHILITHTHGDHSPAARAIAAATGARVLGFGPHPAQSASEAASADSDDTEEHSADLDFRPDAALSHGDVVTGRGWTIESLHTPGHISNHLCFALREEKALFSGDHVMGWSTTVIPPPDGSVSDYLRSLRLLLDRDDSIFYPTHGPPMISPLPYVASLLQHRLEREAQIVARLTEAPQTAVEIVEVLYADTRTELHKPAAMSVLAHLHKLRDDGRANIVDDADLLSPNSSWMLA